MGNDISIIFGITLFLLAIGALIPVINASFATVYTTNVNGTTVYNAAEGETVGATENLFGTVSIWSVLTSAFGMIFWSFGGLPIWLDATLFMALRITLVLVIARNVWIGGGG